MSDAATDPVTAARDAILAEIVKRAEKIPGSEQLRNLAEAYAYVVAPDRVYTKPSPPAAK